jgi:N-formylglutamate amidohydrolase
MLGIVEGAFTARTAAEPTTPVVVSVPHAGVRTAWFEETLTPELDVRGDADLFVDRLYRIGEPEGPETFVAAQLSRFVCDLNRDPDDVAPGAVPEHRAPRNADGRGFIWAVTTSGTPALARPLTLREWSGRTAIHAAYHEAIAGALARARARFGFAVLVDGHSMPSRGRFGHTDTGRVRAEVVPGDREGTSCSPVLLAMVSQHFAAAGLTVKANDPYKGGFITTHHGRPAEHVHAIQIELRRDLYMDEDKFEIVEPGFGRLRDLLAGLLDGLRGFRPAA